MIKIHVFAMMMAASYITYQPTSISVLKYDKAFAPKASIKTGADQTEKYLSYLKGKKVGIVSNQTSIIGNRKTHLVDSLHKLGIN
ncbi:MAG: DUF1343 domain-containing protein, partial [Chitinophagaceae bacterium]